MVLEVKYMQGKLVRKTLYFCYINTLHTDVLYEF